jgi:hypothetical protein
MEFLQQLIPLLVSVDDRMVVKAWTLHFVESVSRTEEPTSVRSLKTST